MFTSTLVDRIVTGYPRGEDQAIWEKLGYQDNLLDTAEPFGLWVIESPPRPFRRTAPAAVRAARHLY